MTPWYGRARAQILVLSLIARNLVFNSNHESRISRDTRRLTDEEATPCLSFSEVACTSGPVFSGVVQSAVERWPFSSRVH